MCQIQLPKQGLSKARAPRGAMTKIESNVHIVAAFMLLWFAAQPALSRGVDVVGAQSQVVPSLSYASDEDPVLRAACNAGITRFTIATKSLQADE
jgi:hypothetical protein